MLFVEQLSIWKYISILHKKQRCVYYKKSFAFRVVNKYFLKERFGSQIERSDFHLVEYTTDIRKNAYDKAYLQLRSIQIPKWSSSIASLFSIDFDLICKKYFFDELYLKYEFIEIAKRYKNENPDEECFIAIRKKYSDPYFNDLNEFEFKSSVFSPERLLFFLSLLFIPILLLYYFKRYKSETELYYEKQIVCLIDEYSTLRMFSDIFKDFSNTSFVIEKHNASAFSINEKRKFKIAVLGLSMQSYQYIKRRVWRYIKNTIFFASEMAEHGLAALNLFNILLKAKGETINGNNNMFVTYEHLVTIKAARNEFLATQKSISVFIPKNAYTATQYFHSEIFINYSIMCSAGQHTIDLLKKKLAKTDIFLHVGSYDNHRGIVNIDGVAQRLKKIKEFKGTDKLITIISPGICDPTLRHEIKLMRLAQNLSNVSGIKVIIRTKPVDPISKYKGFYELYVNGFENILLTHKEHDLFDFLEYTDLFVTSISNAGSDIALSGGNVMFINFTKDSDFFLFWRKLPQIVQDESNVLDKIVALVKHEEDDDVKDIQKKAVLQLVDYIGYRFVDFTSYKENLLRQLTLFLPNK